MKQTDPAIVTPDSPSSGDQIVVHAGYEIFVFLLVIYQIINALLWVLLRDREMVLVVLTVSLIIAIFLIFDSFYRLFRESKRLHWFLQMRGYLIFLGSLPLPFFAIARLVWYTLATRNLRRNDYADARQVVIRRRAQSALLLVILMCLVIIEVAGIFILRAEAEATGANILTAGDALWWTFVTIATVGYGDLYPVTASGRIIGVIVMIIGISFFTVLTSYLAQWFLQSRRSRRQPVKAGSGKSPSLEAIKKLLDEQENAHQALFEEMRARLSEFEANLENSKPR